MPDTTLSTGVTRVAKIDQVYSHEILVNTPNVLDCPILSALRQVFCMIKVNLSEYLVGGGIDQACDIFSVKLWFWREGHILDYLSVIQFRCSICCWLNLGQLSFLS